MVAYYHSPPLKLNYATNVIVLLYITQKCLLLLFFPSLDKNHNSYPLLCTFYWNYRLEKTAVIPLKRMSQNVNNTLLK